MQALLKIPFDEKEQAKKIAKENHCVLYFDSGSWIFKGGSVPAELKKYIISGTEINDEKEKLDWPDFFNENIKKEVEIKKEYFTYVLDLPFELKDTIGNNGGYFNKTYKTYLVKAINLSNDLSLFSSQPYSYENWIENFINKKQREEITEKLAIKDIIIPRGYQKEALEAFKKAYKSGYHGFLLADEVGLGKTISSALISKEKQFQSILIVTTLPAVAHWRNIYLQFEFNGKKILIINYDRLQKLFKPNDEKYKKPAKTRKTKNKRLAKMGDAPVFDLVIFDESHKLKNPEALRTKFAMRIQEKAGFTLYLSATAGQNPLELSYLAPLLASITNESVKNLNDFEKWCQKMDLGVSRGAYGKWSYEANEKSLKKMNELLFAKSCAALRRTPVDIAGYPEINRILQPIELEAEDIIKYNLIWNEFRESLFDIKNNKDKKETNQLVINLRLRQKASILKVDSTIEQALDMLDNKYQVAISVGFKETVLLLKEKFKNNGIEASIIYGEQKPSEKEAERLRFQKGETKVVIFTVEESISLHQGEYNDVPRVLLIHDLRWSAIQMSQIEGRTHRDGKFSQIYWLYFKNTIEEDIAKIVLSKVIGMKTMIGDDTKTLKEIENLLFKKGNKNVHNRS